MTEEIKTTFKRKEKMNRELIKKYRKEFNHWVDGGKLLLKWTDEDPSCWVQEDDVCTNQLWTHSISDIKYVVINDKYVEFYKALAKGKTVQYDEMPDKFIDMVDRQEFKADVSRYRIKPDEPEFKVGDYVVGCKSKRIIPITDLYLTFQKGSYNDHFGENIKLWTLEEADDDEWVYAVHDRHGLEYSTKRASWCKHQKIKAIPMIGQTPGQLGLED